MLALRELANGAPHCFASNDTIRSRIYGLGYEVPSRRDIRKALERLQYEDRLIERTVNMACTLTAQDRFLA